MKESKSKHVETKKYGQSYFGSRKARAPEQPDWTAEQFAPGMPQESFFDIYDWRGGQIPPPPPKQKKKPK